MGASQKQFTSMETGRLEERGRGRFEGGAEGEVVCPGNCLGLAGATERSGEARRVTGRNAAQISGFLSAHSRMIRDLDPEISTTEITEGRRMDGCSNEFLRASVSSVVGSDPS